MLVSIWVKSTYSGKIHQVGTDKHDSLEYIEGKVEYVNLQSYTGTFDGDYIFVEAPSDDNEYVDVTPDMLRLNQALIHRDLLKKMGLSENATVIS